MLNELRTFFDHSRHPLWVRNVDASLDVLAFHGEERLSQPFSYGVEFTCTQHDLGAEQLLGQDDRFSLHAAPQKLPFLGLSASTVKPLRTLHGVITSFKRLSGSNDEARYEITLQPRLALLGCGRQFASTSTNRCRPLSRASCAAATTLRSRISSWTGRRVCLGVQKNY